MGDTKIEWTDAVWNPVTGCTKVSSGCSRCYAERVARRWWGERKFTDVQIHPEKLNIPLCWRTPRRIFVNSMSDLFHEDVPDVFIYDVFGRMMLAKHHTFQVLTKRPERMAKLLTHSLPTNIWLGVSVENQATADERIPLLLKTPAAVRFISAEPLLAPVDLTKHCFRVDGPGLFSHGTFGDFIQWVICGGESGPGARPFDLDWGRFLRDQCKSNGVPFFMKQLGSWPLFEFENAGNVQKGHGKYFGIKDRKGADWNEWPEDLRVREFPKSKICQG